jgi:hypothetical protein
MNRAICSLSKVKNKSMVTTEVRIGTHSNSSCRLLTTTINRAMMEVAYIRK